MRRLYALLGYPLKHSFSKKYFTEKFEKENISNCSYELLELPDCKDFHTLLEQHPDLVGLNVTIPHKINVIPYLTALDPASAGRIGAVNCVKILPNGQTIGYNTDYYGFRQSLEEWLTQLTPFPLPHFSYNEENGNSTIKSLVLGNGGAAKAVLTTLEDLGIDYQTVSRQTADNSIAYENLNEEIIASHQLIINCSPLGTFPNDDECPNIPYHLLRPNHLLYDLVYNPAETLFLKKGKVQGAYVHNGLKMLHLQAEKAWEVWNK